MLLLLLLLTGAMERELDKSVGAFSLSESNDHLHLINYLFLFINSS
jgi:hypothetical protein